MAKNITDDDYLRFYVCRYKVGFPKLSAPAQKYNDSSLIENWQLPSLCLQI
jgi:hypothetical protein